MMLGDKYLAEVKRTAGMYEAGVLQFRAAARHMPSHEPLAAHTNAPLLDLSVFASKRDRQAALVAAWREAALAGHLESYMSLGETYERGLNGQAENHLEALRWFQAAADQGAVEAQVIPAGCAWGFGL